MRQQRQSGFTIVELMIATVVFSIVLLVLAGGIIQIGRLYSKGINSARTQQAARQAIDSVTQAIQFNAGSITTSNVNTTDSASKGYCVGTEFFKFRLGQQRLDNQHALVNSKESSGCQATVPENLSLTNASVTGDELLGERMRLSNFEITPATAGPLPSSYRVTVRVIYGDYDVLCSATESISCTDAASVFENESKVIGVKDLACKSIRGSSQFCAVSQLSTIVERRIQ